MHSIGANRKRLRLTAGKYTAGKVGYMVGGHEYFGYLGDVCGALGRSHGNILLTKQKTSVSVFDCVHVLHANSIAPTLHICHAMQFLPI